MSVKIINHRKNGKIKELLLIDHGIQADISNGFLFRDYDPGGLWYGLDKAVRFHRCSLDFKERHVIRIMKETRENHNLNRMIQDYIKVYEELSNGIPIHIQRPDLHKSATEYEHDGFVS